MQKINKISVHLFNWPTLFPAAVSRWTYNVGRHFEFNFWFWFRFTFRATQWKVQILRLSIYVLFITMLGECCCPYVPCRICANNTDVICQYLHGGAVAAGHVGKSSWWHFRIDRVYAHHGKTERLHQLALRHDTQIRCSLIWDLEARKVTLLPENCWFRSTTVSPWARPFTALLVEFFFNYFYCSTIYYLGYRHFDTWTGRTHNWQQHSATKHYIILRTHSYSHLTLLLELACFPEPSMQLWWV